MFRRVILEESDGQYQPYGNTDQRPMEYEMPTRGQSFTDGVANSFWKSIAVGLIILAITIFILVVL